MIHMILMFYFRHVFPITKHLLVETPSDRAIIMVWLAASAGTVIQGCKNFFPHCPDVPLVVLNGTVVIVLECHDDPSSPFVAPADLPPTVTPILFWFCT